MNNFIISTSPNLSIDTKLTHLSNLQNVSDIIKVAISYIISNSELDCLFVGYFSEDNVPVLRFLVTQGGVVHNLSRKSFFTWEEIRKILTSDEWRTQKHFFRCKLDETTFELMYNNANRLVLKIFDKKDNKSIFRFSLYCNLVEDAIQSMQHYADSFFWELE
jgi:hypothetical protein